MGILNLHVTSYHRNVTPGTLPAASEPERNRIQYVINTFGKRCDEA